MENLEIKPISATWYKEDGDEKSQVYRLLNMVHVMAGQLAQNKDSGWSLSRTATMENYALTVWTNGVVDITAETQKSFDGDYVLSHFYKLDKCKE